MREKEMQALAEAIQACDECVGELPLVAAFCPVHRESLDQMFSGAPAND